MTPGFAAPASRRRICAAATAKKIAGRMPALRTETHVECGGLPPLFGSRVKARESGHELLPTPLATPAVAPLATKREQAPALHMALLPSRRVCSVANAVFRFLFSVFRFRFLLLVSFRGLVLAEESLFV